jgi:hypothetical protein
MAYYKYANFLKQETGAEYDAVHNPGAATPYSGIYRCTGCGLSITSVLPHPLPPQNHHQHTTAAPIRWQLVVKSHFR